VVAVKFVIKGLQETVAASQVTSDGIGSVTAQAAESVPAVAVAPPLAAVVPPAVELPPSSLLPPVAPVPPVASSSLSLLLPPQAAIENDDAMATNPAKPIQFLIALFM
jgi:hypothetical protein